MPILVITRSRKTAHQVIMSRSTIPCLTSEWHGTEEVAEAAIQHAKAAGLVRVGDLIPVVFGRVGTCAVCAAVVVVPLRVCTVVFLMRTDGVLIYVLFHLLLLFLLSLSLQKWSLATRTA